MHRQTRVILTWGVLLILLWAAAFLSVRWAIGVHTRSADDARAHRALLSLWSAEAQRMQRMRQGARLMMTVPEMRALAGETHGGVSEENIGTLTGRLDALRALVDASCVCVLDSTAAAVAQNSGSPWGSLEELRSFLEHSPQASAMVTNVFDAAMRASPDQPPPEVWGLWTSGSELYHVVGMPLLAEARDEDAPARAGGALIAATRVGDGFARTLSRASGCEVTFVTTGRIAASSLPADLRSGVARFADASAGGPDLHAPAEIDMGESSYRSILRPVIDPCSGVAVGAVMIQSDVAGSRALQRSVSVVFTLLLAGGLVSAAVMVRVGAARRATVVNPFAGTGSAGRPTPPVTSPFRLEMPMTSPPPPSPAVPLDYDALVRRCCGNAAVAERVIEKFAAQLGDVVENLRRNLDASDAAELAKTAHALKGTAAMTGAEGVRGFAEGLEKLGREGRIDGAESLLGSLGEQIDACLAFISQRKLAAGGVTGTPAPGPKGMAA